MALSKLIIQNDGVPTTYHRILFIDQMINQGITINVISYVDQAARERDNSEQEYRVYNACCSYALPYKENMTVEEAYDFLKTLIDFENAEDI